MCIYKCVLISYCASSFKELSALVMFNITLIELVFLYNMGDGGLQGFSHVKRRDCMKSIYLRNATCLCYIEVLDTIHKIYHGIVQKVVCKIFFA